MKRKTTKKQIRIDIKSNAGGTGKTTMAVHLAYLLAKKGYSVVIIELDPQGTLKVFSGLDKPESDQTLAAVLSDDFKGQYPLVPIWKEHIGRVEVIQGGESLYKTIKEIQQHERGPYLLNDRLEDYPLDADVLVLDNPASLEPMGLVALAAATHILVPIQCEYKAVDGAGGLVEWFYTKINNLRLRPEPEILGFVPSRKDIKIAAHRNISSSLPQYLEQLGIHCFPAIRDSNDFINASGVGLPLQLYRSKCSAGEDFNPIVFKLIELMEGK